MADRIGPDHLEIELSTADLIDPAARTESRVGFLVQVSLVNRSSPTTEAPREPGLPPCRVVLAETDRTSP